MRQAQLAYCFAFAALAGIVVPARGAAKELAPRLHALLKDARVVAPGRVEELTPYATGRVALAAFSAAKLLVGPPPEGAARLSVVEMRELPTPPIFAAGDRGVAFLKSAPRSTFLVETLPPGTYYELAARDGFLKAASEPEYAEIEAIVAKLVAASRNPEGDHARRAAANRQLVFDLIGAHHPLLVEDGADSLGTIAQISSTLTGEEQARLEAALRRADLRLSARLALVRAVAQAGIKQVVPVLETLDSPAQLQETAWQALAALDAAPTEKQLDERLAGADPQVRAAAVRELLRRKGTEAVSAVAPLALQDPDDSVRIAVLDALGELKKPAALPPLERAFAENEGPVQQAAARAMWTIGGDAAADSLARLALTAPIGSQRYAVALLIVMVGRTDPRVTHLEETHPEASIRGFIEHGLEHEH